MLNEIESLIVKGLKELLKKEIDTPALQIIHDIYKDIRLTATGRDEKDFLFIDNNEPRI